MHRNRELKPSISCGGRGKSSIGGYTDIQYRKCAVVHAERIKSPEFVPSLGYFISSLYKHNYAQSQQLRLHDCTHQTYRLSP